MLSLEQIRQVAAPVCAEVGVKRLDVFGSLARGETRGDSDIDLLVEFDKGEGPLHRRFFRLLHHLEDALGRNVDLLTQSGLRNPYFRRRVLEERVQIYGPPISRGGGPS